MKRLPERTNEHYVLCCVLSSHAPPLNIFIRYFLLTLLSPYKLKFFVENNSFGFHFPENFFLFYLLLFDFLFYFLH